MSSLRKQATPEERIRELLDGAELQLTRAFVEITDQLRGEQVLSEIADLIEQGRIQEALESAARAGAQFAARVNGVIISSGVDTAEFIAGQLQVIVSFDTVNARVVRIQQRNQLNLIREFSQEMRLATQQALVDGIQRGLNPREQARLFRDSIGLTQRQVDMVNNFRRLLEQGSLEALQRQLRDRRFDSTIRRAARTGTPLTREQIERMVGRFRERLIRQRAQTIARTEALRAVHEGSEEMWRQAFEQGLVQPEQVTRTWVTAGDARVRDSHTSMNGQVRPVGEAFLSGQGNSLQHPGDINAPASEVVNCRCVIATRIN